MSADFRPPFSFWARKRLKIGLEIVSNVSKQNLTFTMGLLKALKKMSLKTLGVHFWPKQAKIVYFN